MKKVKIGIVQSCIKASKFGKKAKKQNLKKVEEIVSELLERESNIDIVVLPEEFYSGGAYNFTNIPCNLEDVEEKVLKDLKIIAKDNKCYITGSIILNRRYEDVEDKRDENLGFIIDRNGEVIGYQGKFHTFEEEGEYIKREKSYNVFDLDIGKVALVIGIDIFYPEIARNYALIGAEIIIAPSLITKLSDKETEEENNLFIELAKRSVKAAAIQNQIFFIYVNGLGDSIYVDGEFFGQSLVSTPLGRNYCFDEEETVEVVEIDKSEIDVARGLIPLFNLRNNECCIVDSFKINEKKEDLEKDKGVEAFETNEDVEKLVTDIDEKELETNVGD